MAQPPSPLDSKASAHTSGKSILANNAEEAVSDFSRDDVHQDDGGEQEAAKVIQRTFRGHRTRRAMDGLTLDPGSRWIELIKEAQYRKLIRPHSRTDSTSNRLTQTPSTERRSAFAQSEWRRLRHVARRAGNVDDGDSSTSDADTPPEQRAAARQKRATANRQRRIEAKGMGIEYFLEMMDEKHRYGSHLRAYHAVWKQADTRENFFYWLDFGEGREVEVGRCSREHLERDQVRYLKRSERQKYLINIDKEGRLRYAKNNLLVTTSQEFRDSLEGIVRREDPAPAYSNNRRHLETTHDDKLSSASSISSASTEDDPHYANPPVDPDSGVKQVHYISAAALMNHLLASTTKKNTWIFVADTSFRLYIGIKQSGAFQHSSFLQGARVSAAGVIKVKDGLIRSLSPLSGHYRPPTSNFRAFVGTLKERGADLSRVSISKSYAVLLGVEGYMRTKKRAKDSVQRIKLSGEKVFRPDEARARREREADRSESAAKEREWVLRERQAKWEGSLAGQVSKKMGIKSPPLSPRSDEGEKSERRLGF